MIGRVLSKAQYLYTLSSVSPVHQWSGIEPGSVETAFKGQGRRPRMAEVESATTQRGPWDAGLRSSPYCGPGLTLSAHLVHQTLTNLPIQPETPLSSVGLPATRCSAGLA
jgi:hypothetical protein